MLALQGFMRILYHSCKAMSTIIVIYILDNEYHLVYNPEFDSLQIKKALQMAVLSHLLGFCYVMIL